MKSAIYNPHNVGVPTLPVIYGFNNGGGSSFLHAVLIAEDGTHLGSHMCSAESWMPRDLGIYEGTRPDRHETFRKHYPDGYRMEFVKMSAAPSHEKLMNAITKNQLAGEKNEREES